MRDRDKCDPDVFKFGEVVAIEPPSVTREEADAICDEIEQARPGVKADWSRSGDRVIIKVLDPNKIAQDLAALKELAERTKNGGQ